MHARLGHFSSNYDMQLSQTHVTRTHLLEQATQHMHPGHNIRFYHSKTKLQFQIASQLSTITPHL